MENEMIRTSAILLCSVLILALTAAGMTRSKEDLNPWVFYGQTPISLLIPVKINEEFRMIRYSS